MTESVLESHGPVKSLELSKVQIGLETTELRVDNETQIATVVGGRSKLRPSLIGEIGGLMQVLADWEPDQHPSCANGSGASFPRVDTHSLSGTFVSSRARRETLSRERVLSSARRCPGAWRRRIGRGTRSSRTRRP